MKKTEVNTGTAISNLGLKARSFTKSSGKSAARSAAKPIRPSKAEELLNKSMSKIDRFFDKLMAISIRLGMAIGRILAAIIIVGITINIAAEFWPNLKTEIPFIYGFFNGLLQGVEWLFEKGTNFFKK